MGPSFILKEEDKCLNLLIGKNNLTLSHSDITQIETDAIVCPVNQTLDTSFGVAHHIMNAAGPSVRGHKPVFPEPFGKVVVLPGGKLKAKFIFLTVLMGEQGLDKIKLAITHAVDRAIRYAEFLRLHSIGFPVMGSPKLLPPYDFVAKEMLEQVVLYFTRRNTKLKTVQFSVFNTDAFEIFKREAKDIAKF